MINYTSILSGALMDYTEWASKQINVPVIPNELRGIFYNKLMARLKEVHNVADLRRVICVEDIQVVFNMMNGYITFLSFATTGYSTLAGTKSVVLGELNKALLNIDVADYHDRFTYELSKVVLDLKNSLNYGR